MTLPDEPLIDDQPASIVGVYVGAYKNLADLWFNWSSANVLFGANGIGKTNLLECFSLLMGSDETRRLVADRAPTLDSIRNLSVVLQEHRDDLPLPPAQCLIWGLGERGTAAEASAEWARKLPWLASAAADGAWWRTLGVVAGESLQEGLLAGVVDAHARELLWDLVEPELIAPKIRYRLGAPSNGRRVQRTLVMRPKQLRDRKAELREIQSVLPAAFAPLQAWLSERGRASQDRYVDVLALPERAGPPVVLQWLPRDRSGEEVLSDLGRAFDSAHPHVAQLAASLEELVEGVGVHTRGLHIEDEWWPQEEALRAAQTELQLAMPHLDVVADSSYGFELYSRKANLGLLGDESDVMQRLSAGERRWMDEALAQAANAVRRLGVAAVEQRGLLHRLREEDALEGLAEISTSVEWGLVTDEYWSMDNVRDVIQALASRMLAEKIKVHGMDTAAAKVVTAGLAGLQLRRTLQVRLFDEPEAHLHASSQVNILAALECIRQDADVVVATHNARFLNRPGWEHHELRQREDRVVLSRFDPSDLAKRNEVASRVGISSGELLVNTNAVLFVEGEHDLLILRRYFQADLEGAGVTMLPIRGTPNLLSVASLEFVDKLLMDLPVGVMLDNTRASIFKMRPRERTPEEHSFVQLVEAMREQGRTVELLPLDRPDIIAYLNEEAVRTHQPNFTSWTPIIETYRDQKARDFKAWLRREYGVVIGSSHDIDIILATMDRQQRSLEPGVAVVVKDFCTKVIGSS